MPCIPLGIEWNSFGAFSYTAIDSGVGGTDWNRWLGVPLSDDHEPDDDVEGARAGT